MFGILAVVAFIIAVIMYVANLASGHLTYVLFALVGFLCLSLHGLGFWTNWRHTGA